MRINVNTIARKVDVDNRIPLRYYYRIADNLLKQANIYRQEKNIVDLYIILLRYSSLVSETIPFHLDYQGFLPKEKVAYKKRLLAVLDELESLKPEFLRQVDELNKAHAGAQLLELDCQDRTSHGSVAPSYLEWPGVNGGTISSMDIKQPANIAIQSSWKYNNDHTQVIFQTWPNLTSSSRSCCKNYDCADGISSFFCSVHYPSNMDLISAENSSVNQAGKSDTLALKDGDLGGISSTMESVLSLDDGRWSRPAEELCPPLINEKREDPFHFVSIKQPLPPPVLAEVQQDYAPISPSKVADPRPGPAKHSQDGPASTNSYQHLHVPVTMMEDFLRLARANTEKNLETCGVLAGSLKNRVFHITTLIIPKQESTSDSCSTLNEEEIFDYLFSHWGGFIHTQRRLVSCHQLICMLITHIRLCHRKQSQLLWPQLMHPVHMAYFILSNPGGVSVIRNCQQRGFQPHEEPSDGSSIYEYCSHVFMNPKLKFDVVDLR